MSANDYKPNDDIDASALLLEYSRTRDIELRNKLVMHYSYIAKICAVQMRGIFQNYAQIDDIVNQGIITLIECIEKYDPEKSNKFEAYAYMRVKGAIISLVRQQDWIPRRVRMTAKKIQQAHDELSNRLMREPTMQELSEYMDMPLPSLEKAYYEISSASMLSFEGLIQNVNQMGDVLEDFSDENSNVDGNIYKRELHETLTKAINELSERERLVITLIYYEHLKASDIAQILDVSVQRVSQISTKAIMKLRHSMEDYMKG